MKGHVWWLPMTLFALAACAGAARTTGAEREWVTAESEPLQETLLNGAPEGEPGPATPEIEQFMRILSASSPSRGADGSVYYVTWTTGVDQLYVLPPTGEAAEQLTSFADGLDYYALAPDGSHVALGASVGGSEQSDLYLLDLESRVLTPLFENPEVRYENVLWREDSGGFFYRSNEANGTDFFLYAYDLAAGTGQLLAETPGYNWLSDVDPSGRQVLVTRYQSNADSDVFLFTLGADGVEEQHLTPHEGEVQYRSPSFDATGSIWVHSDRDADRLRIGVLDRATGAVDYRNDDPWEVSEMVMSQDGATIAYVTNEEGYGRLHLFDVAGGDVTTPEDPSGGIVTVSELRDGRLMMVFTSPTRTDDVWELDLATSALRQVTFSDYAGIDRASFAEPQLVHYPTFDGRMIPAFLYLPAGYDGGIVPTIIDVHGGPESQFRPTFVRHFQYLMLNGFAVFAPNVRGSSGYGPEYMALDNYTLRRDAVADIGAAVDWLIASGYADHAHLGIKGASYGGYMVMAAITEMPDRFAAAAETVGIVNFVTFLENTADYRRALREAEYGPLTDRAFLESISPIHRIDAITAPLLVIHGENDSRVPVSEARQVIEALEARSVPVESLIFPDEGHGVSHLENRLVMYRMMVDFFARHLGGDG